MNNFFKKSYFKSLTVLLILLISSVSVFAADNNILTEKPLQGTEVFLSFVLLLFIILAPAFKRRERTTFIGSNHKYFTI